MRSNAIKTKYRPALAILAGMAGLAGAACGAVLHDGAGRLEAALTSPVPEPAFVAVAQILAAACGCWLAIGTLCTLLGEASWAGQPAARLVSRLLPPGWRRTVLTAVGTGVLSGSAVAIASAAGMPTDPDHSLPPQSAVAVLDGLALPDRAAGAWRPPDRSVTVRAGDSLWALSASALPPGADAGAIARRCWRWYGANAEVIGDDPDLLLPGTRLLPPAAAALRTAR